MQTRNLTTTHLQPEPFSVPRTISRTGWLALGYLLFGIGILGMFLPVMPTTVFWILAAGCFLKSSPAMYQRIITSPRYGRPGHG